MTAAIIEAAYRFDLPPLAYLRELGRAAASEFKRPGQVVAIAFRHLSSERTEVQAEVARGDGSVLGAIHRGARILTGAERQRTVAMRPSFEACSVLFGVGPVLDLFREHAFGDLIGLMCPLDTTSGIVLCCTHDEPTSVRPNERRYFNAAAVHLASAARLRRALEQDGAEVGAVLRPDGKVLHLASDLRARSAREELRSTVLERERRRARRAADAEDGMPGLLEGGWTLADRFESDGQRYVVAYRVPDDACLLSEPERHALALAVRGIANKAIALELGVSQATVTRLVGRALEALRLTSVGEAMTLAARAPDLWLGDEPNLCAWRLETASAGVLGRLSSAERDVVERVAQGASRAQVALARGTSANTVHRQLASAFAKLGVSSRRELLRHLASK